MTGLLVVTHFLSVVAGIVVVSFMIVALIDLFSAPSIDKYVRNSRDNRDKKVRTVTYIRDREVRDLAVLVYGLVMLVVLYSIWISTGQAILSL